MGNRIVYYCLLFAVGACSDKEIQPVPANGLDDSTGSAFEVVWSHASDQGFQTMDAIVEYEQSIIMKLWKGYSQPAYLLAMDKKSGDTLWANPISSVSSQSPEFYLHEDLLIYTQGASVCGTNAVTGEAVWSLPAVDNTRKISGLSLTNGRLFVSYSIGDKYQNDSCQLYEIDLQSGSPQLVYSLQAQAIAGYSPAFQIGKIYTMDKGDQILLFANRALNWHTIENRMDVIAYNLTADSVFWQISGLNDIEAGNKAPLIVEDLFIVPGSGKLFAIHIPSGTLRWEQGTDVPRTGINLSNFIHFRGKLLINPGNMAVLNTLRAKDGLLLGSEYTSGSPWSSMTQHNGKLYYTNDVEIWCHAMDNGRFLWKSASPFSHDRFRGTLLIDPETGYFYATDEHHILCMKLK